MCCIVVSTTYRPLFSVSFPLSSSLSLLYFPHFSVVESFIGEERLIRMWSGMGERVRGQAKHARAEGRDIIIATPGRTMQLVSMNIIRWVLDYSIFRKK